MTNKIHDAFDQIEASEQLKSSTLQFLHGVRRHTAQPAHRLVFAACAVCLLFLGIGGYYTTQTPVSYISIDVNPSVELALNCYDRVVSAAAYNEDGEAILEDVRVKGRLYTDAIDAIVESAAMQPYLASASSALTFTVAASDSTKETTILTGITSSPSYRHHLGQSHTADVESLSEAHESGLSFGKYAAYLALSQFDSTITPEDCRNMSMGEIHSQIKEYENCGGCGNGGTHRKHGH